MTNDLDDTEMTNSSISSTTKNYYGNEFNPQFDPSGENSKQAQLDRIEQKLDFLL